ncbi:MAG: N-acetylmuramoyl-L-alanine amidase [Eubacteriaceae bacterium]|jgi:N-acetylmuramoyl-L-alanine amidase|nr:N-acetylmuramoyl-L-alanine amidase [Eubacteriaceae bacterium]
MKNSIAKITAVICCAALAAVSCLLPAAVSVPAQAAVLSRSQITVAIDPGHQKKQDLGMERVDPDNAKLGKKYKMAGGCSSVYNHMGEYRYTMIIAKKLRADLLKRGYKVYMVRTSNDVDLSCQKRARMVNTSGSKICVRLHCDSYGSSAHGVSTIYKPGHNSYYSTADAARSKVLASYMLNGECRTTGFAKRYNDARNDMTGQNWSRIPVALIEMGFFSNYSEAKKMSTEKYQDRITRGIANGIEKYMVRYYHVDEAQ